MEKMFPTENVFYLQTSTQYFQMSQMNQYNAPDLDSEAIATLLN